jgi:acetolactate synthase-1/2/3 large subunit
VDTIFTLCGGHVMPIYEGCRLEGMRVVDVRHEQAAAHAAEAWGRINRACGVAVVTAGPGVTGVVTAVANSFSAQTPLVVIGGARPLVQAGQGALQELDQRAILAPITKWSAVCTQPDRISDHVATAFRHALAQPRGPVYLELPMDVLFAEASASGTSTSSRSDARAFGDPREVMKAADLLTKAERPAVVAGTGVWWDGAWKQLRAFAENGQLPIFLNGSGRGALPPDHPLFFQHARGKALAEADVICVIGTPLDFRLKFGRFPKKRSSSMSTRTRGARTQPRTRRRDRGGLRRGARHPGGRRQTGLGSHRVAGLVEPGGRDLVGGAPVRDRVGLGPASPLPSGAELDRVLDPDTIVIGDGGDVVAAVSRVLRVHRPGHWLDPGPFGCLGVGPPYALGVKAARPDKQVVVVAGDGAFGLNGFEFETLTRLGLPAVFVIGKRRGLGRDPHSASRSVRRRRGSGDAPRADALRAPDGCVRRPCRARGAP